MAKAYNRLTVGTSFKPIGIMLSKSNALLPFSQATGIHDNGCGPGPVISRLITDYGPVIPPTATLSASDFSSGMVAQVEKAKAEEVAADPSSPWARLQTRVKDAMDLQGIADESQSHVTAGWVYFMTPDPRKCLQESLRVLQPGGVLACSSWKGSQWLDVMRKVTEVRPDAPMPEIPKAWMSTQGIHGEMEQAGFRDVEAVEVEVEMAIDSAEKFVVFLTTKMPHMVQLLKDWSEEEMERLREVCLRTMKGMLAQSPGILKGVALVGVGRK